MSFRKAIFPLMSLFFFVAIYVIFFSDNGLIMMFQLKAQKNKLVQQIEALKKKKENLEQTLGILKDNEKALEKFTLEKFTKDLLLDEKKVHILKFEQEEKRKQVEISPKAKVESYRKVAIISMILSFLLVVFFSFYFDKTKKEDSIESQ